MVAKKNILSSEMNARVQEAIRKAEERTSGEIYCVLARSSDSYFFPSAFFVALAILFISIVSAWALHNWWIVASPLQFVLAQLAALGAALGILQLFPALRILLVPHGLRRRRAHDHALRQFLTRDIHLTTGRTGALIFVSLAERYAEVVVDTGIGAKVPQERWAEAVEALTQSAAQGDLAQGFIDAIAIVGHELASHFPPGHHTINEIENHLAEI